MAVFETPVQQENSTGDAGSPDSIFLEEATLIGERLCEARIFARDKSFTWIGPSGYGTKLNPLRLGKLGPYLYDGASGVAVFLAALDHTLGPDFGFGEIALQSLAPLRQKMKGLASDPERADRISLQIGGLLGVGSLIYAFLAVGELLGVRALEDEAHDLTVFLTPARIAQDQRVRIQTGSAGTILAMMALHARRPGPNRNGRTPLQIAAECADHLVNERISFEGLPRAWRLSPGKPPLMGFGYGAAGIVYALSQLYRVKPSPRIREAAEEGLAFVQGLYSPERRSWRDLRAEFEARYQDPSSGTWKDWWFNPAESLENRSGAQPMDVPEEASPRDPFPSSWCHGSAGISLGLLACSDSFAGPEARAQATCAIRSLGSLVESPGYVWKGAADLCCGHMGRADVLLEASRRLEDAQILESARRLASRVVRRARETGGYELSAARGTDVFAPGLFQGIAGVGYALLRLVYPDRLPCLLLLE
jgi:lantibiotic modifying enzyme